MRQQIPSSFAHCHVFSLIWRILLQFRDCLFVSRVGVGTGACPGSPFAWRIESVFAEFPKVLLSTTFNWLNFINKDPKFNLRSPDCYWVRSYLITTVMEQIWYLHIFIRPGGTYLVAQLIFSQTNEDDLWEQCCIPHGIFQLNLVWNLQKKTFVPLALQHSR